MKEEIIENELQALRKGLEDLNKNLAKFVEETQIAQANIQVGEKSVTLSSSKLSTEHLLQLCAYTIEQVKDK